LNNRRTGKVARLPKEIRDQVNARLRDGLTYLSIAAWLSDLSYGDISESNLSNWFEGGYLDWQQHQDRLETDKLKREFALELVKENEGSQIHEATLQLAASQLYEVLTDFNVGPLKETLADKPGLYPKIVNSLAKLSEGGLKYERYRDEVKSRKAVIERELGAAQSKGGITPETLDKIKHELNLL
jgi:hypothetical protein